MTEVEVKLEKIVPVSLPLYVVAWLQEKVDRIKEKNPRVRVGVGTIAKAIIITHYEEETGTGKKKETPKKSASAPAPGKELRPEEKAESEIRIVNEETIRKDIVNFPPTIAVPALIKILKKKGYTEKQAKQAVDLLVFNKIYRKEGNLLILNKEGKQDEAGVHSKDHF